MSPTHQSPLDRLTELGHTLPGASTPGGSYVSVNVRNNIAYVAIQFPILNGNYHFQGRLGEDLNTDDGYNAMQMCALNVLSQIHHKVGFGQVLGLNHIDAYYRGSTTWDDAPKIVDGASELFVGVLGESGQHTRAIFGVEHLPRNFSVGLTTSFTLK